MQQRLYALLDAGTSRFTDIQRALGISTNHLGSLLNYEVKSDRIERVSRGHYRRVA